MERGSLTTLPWDLPRSLPVFVAENDASRAPFAAFAKMTRSGVRLAPKSPDISEQVGRERARHAEWRPQRGSTEGLVGRRIRLRAARVMLVLAALASTLIPHAAHATTPPSLFGDRELAYTRGGDVFRLTLAGAHVGVTGSAAVDARPAWSPDGYRVAFATDRWDASHPRIAVTDTRGTVDLLDVSGGSADDYYERPAWNADGTAIAYAGFTAGNWDIYARDWRAEDPASRLTTDPGRDHDPIYSPDGSTIAFTSDRTGYADVFTMDPSGGNQINVTDSDGIDEASPTWSPDGAELAYEAGGVIYARTLSTGATRVVAGARGFLATEPAWSPDGAYIAFAGAIVPGDFDIYVARADGSTPAPNQQWRLTDHADNETAPVWEPQHPVDDTGPTFTITSVDPPVDNTTWSREPVTVTFTCADDESQVVTIEVTDVVEGDGRDQTASAPCLDYAGNMTNATLPGINIDATPPTATIQKLTGTTIKFLANGTSSDATSGIVKAYVEFTLYGTASTARATVHQLDSKCAVPCTRWEVKNQLARPGLYDVWIHVIDRAGNEAWPDHETMLVSVP